MTLRTLTGHAGKHRVDTALNDGVLTLDGSLRMTAHRVLTAARDMMAPPQQKLFHDGMISLNLLDSIDDAVKDNVAVHNINGVRTSLNQAVTRARNDPNVRKMMDEYNNSTRKITEYNNVAIGTVSNTDRTLFNQRRGYVPMQKPKEKRSLIDVASKLGEAKAPATVHDFSNPYLQKRNTKDINDRIAAHFTPNANTPQPDIMHELGETIADNVKHGGENQARGSGSRCSVVR